LPNVLREQADEYFELNGVESPYMLLVANVQKKHLRELTPEEKQAKGFDKLKVIRSDIPAVTHVDNSARIQTISHDDHPRYYNTIRAFYERTGCPVIINTSFNVRGEPIVCTPKEAYTCFMRTNMDYLCMGSFLLDKTQQKQWHDDTDWKKEFELD
jgi:carbamoyltransferase